ncbi:hypothetical protein [Polaromonas sp. P5_D5]
MLVFKQQTGFLESAFLAGCFNADQNLGGGQNLRKTVHNNLLVAELCTLQRVDRKKGIKKPLGATSGFGVWFGAPADALQIRRDRKRAMQVFRLHAIGDMRPFGRSRTP